MKPKTFSSDFVVVVVDVLLPRVFLKKLNFKEIINLINNHLMNLIGNNKITLCDFN